MTDVSGRVALVTGGAGGIGHLLAEELARRDPGLQPRGGRLRRVLRSEDVAAKIADAIGRGRRVLLLPPVVGLLPVPRALPPRAFDRLMDLFGVNASMGHFVGHGDSRAGVPDADPGARSTLTTPGSHLTRCDPRRRTVGCPPWRERRAPRVPRIPRIPRSSRIPRNP